MSVTANGRTITHKGDGDTNAAAPPDVCKTPSPGGPVPLPYPNIAKTSDLSKGSKKTKIEGNSIALKSSNLSTSTGDEAGTAGGGIVSSKTKGKMGWAMSSMDVKVESKGVIRFMDPTLHNGNTYNDAFTQQGGTGLAYGDDFKGKCEVCGKGPEKHRVMEQKETFESVTTLLEMMQKEHDAAVGRANARMETGADPSAANAAADHIATVQEDGVSFGGYMVGVMVCKCRKSGGKPWAARSGATTKKFRDVAATKFDVCGDAANESKDSISEADFLNQAAPPAKKTPDETVDAFLARRDAARKKREAAQEKWKEVGKKTGQPGYNVRGRCAAYKLIVRSGHKPYSMTESFFMPGGGPKTLTYLLYVTERKRVTKAFDDYSDKYRSSLMSNREAGDKRERKFATGSSVASCHACQELLYMLLCDLDEKSC